MRIERSRSPQMVTITVRGKDVLRPRVGYAQRQALGLLARLGNSEAPPKGKITATGVLREHIFNDMIPLGWVNVKRLKPGVTEYYLTALGRNVLKSGIVADPPKRAKPASSLLARQRKAAEAKGRPAAASGRKRAAA